MSRRLLTVGLAMLFVAVANFAQAGGYGNTALRKLGLGWSDGYHAHNGPDPGAWSQWQPPPTPAPYVHPPLPMKKPSQEKKPIAAPEPRAARRGEPIPPSQQATPRPAYWR